MHLYKLPSGRWRWIVALNGSRRSGSAKTKGEAKAAGTEAELALGKVPRGVNATVEELLIAHLADQGYSPNVEADLRRILNRLVEADDVCLSWKIREVEPVMVAALYRRLKVEGWKPNTVRRFHMLLGSAFSRAVEYGWVNPSPIRGARAPEVPRAKVVPPTVDQVRTMLANVDGTVALFLRLSATTGARRGELCALQWADLDQGCRAVVVARSVAHAAGVGLVVNEEGKTGQGGHRVIALDRRTGAMLRLHRLEQHRHAQARDLPDPLWVFSHDRGQTPWRGDYISRAFRLAARKAGLSGIKLHGLRHHVATMMLAEGEPVVNVAHRLGHRSSATTLGVYAHFVPAADKAAAGRLAGHLDR